ncbi:MAG: hypothetical protein Q8L35_08275 [Actinomycetota bacterium]|nr:hypothetical protein [Actinomycetota bacterium]
MSEPFSVMDIKTAIVRHRFPFPSGEKPAWRTYVNDADNPLAALSTADGEVYPDILVIDRATTTNKHIMAASVCMTEPSVDDLADWRRISEAVDFFYVFVREGHCQHAVDLAATGNIQVSGYRYYGYDGGAIIVTDCF